ncbi:MAG: hypothetical protein WKF96_21950 [Solirubrobacteraceae bacterium]
MTAGHIEQLIAIADTSLTVEQIATAEPYRIEPDADTADVLDQLTNRGFDFALVRHRLAYVCKQDLVNAVGEVSEHARQIQPQDLVSVHLGLASAIARLEHQDVLFVFGREEPLGIVTRADLARPAASMIVLALILAAETGLHEIIQRAGPDCWRVISAAQITQVEERFQQLVINNAELTRADCLTLVQRLEVVGKTVALRQSLGYSSRRAVMSWKNELKKLRNDLAHAGNLVSASGGDPVRAARLVGKVQRFAECVAAGSNPR